MHYHQLILWIHNNPQWGHLVAFLVALGESLAVVGTIIPGSVTMTAIGILAGSHVLPFWTVISCAILGAIIGDGFSYYLGYRYKENLPTIWPFSRHPKILQKGRLFVDRHGGKSVLFGRFVGPIRAIVPIIAGMLNMKPIRYFSASIPSAIAWAPAYMLPGILIGAVSLDIPHDLAEGLIITVLLTILLIWLLLITVHYLYDKTHNYFANILDAKWQAWQTKRSKRFLCYLLRHADRPPHQRGQILMASCWILAVVAFWIVFANIILHGPLTSANHLVYHLIRGIRTPLLDHVFVFISSLGKDTVLLPIVPVLFCYFALRGKWNAAIHWIIVTLCAAGGAFIFKTVFFVARPSGIVHQVNTSSFPSGHTTLAIALYGLLAFYVAQNIPTLYKAYKKTWYWFIILLCASIALSRLYLSAHWLTDIMGSILLGLGSLWFTIISYQRFPQKKLSIASIIVITVLSVGLSDFHYLHTTYHANLNRYRAHWQTHKISEQDWWTHQADFVPIYRKNRLGHPVELLNIQWAGSLKTIQQTLQQHGWYNIRAKAYHTQITKKGMKLKVAQHRTLLPKLYDDQTPVIEALKFVNQQSPPVVLRLWSANIKLVPRNLPLWVGTLYYDTADKHLFFIHHITKEVPIIQLSHPLFNYLEYAWNVKFVNIDTFPNTIMLIQSTLHTKSHGD